MSQPRNLIGKKFLDASLVPVEAALMERATELSSDIGRERVKRRLLKQLQIHDANHRGNAEASALAGALSDILAEELRNLAEELRHW
jgi:hypothetical protein